MSLPKGTITVYVLLIAIAALLIPVVRIEINVLQHTRETITYPHDKTFLNMAVAQNLAFHTVWGISKYSFQSASSSPLYTILLAVVYFILGANLIIPLIINLLAALFLLIVVQRWLIQQEIPAAGQLLILLLLIFLTPLPPIIISGTEQTLLLLISFLFIRTFVEAAASAPGSSRTATSTPGSSLPRWVYLYAAGMVLTGYECSLIALTAIGFLCWRRQWSSAAKLAAAAFLPFLLFGLLSISKGGYFLPNTLLDSSAILSRAATLAIGNAIIFIGAALFRYSRKQGISQRRKPEAAQSRISLTRAGLIAALLLVSIPLCLQSADAFTNTGQGCIDLYHRQYQAARFVHRYYNGWGIIMNEPGVISWWSEGNKLDLSGMASSNVMKSLRTHTWSPAIADSLSRRVWAHIAIVSNAPGSLPDLSSKWSKVATWEFPGISEDDSNSGRGNNTGHDSLSFYVADTSSIKTLRNNLQEYQPSLPPETIVRYY